MSRRRKTIKRPKQIDPKYGSEMVAHMINYLMRMGKKTVAETIVYGAIEEIGRKVEGEDPLEVVNKAVNNMKPRVEVKSRRVGGSTYQVPVEIKPNRQLALALRWLRDNFDQPIRIDALADMAGMGESTLHHHFRAVTAMSPLQYQKHLRLHEARRLMIAERLDAGSAALRVGYESATQFNREYRRLFGIPPKTDVRAILSPAS